MINYKSMALFPSDSKGSFIEHSLKYMRKEKLKHFSRNSSWQFLSL